MKLLKLFKRKQKPLPNFEAEKRSKLIEAFTHEGHTYYRFPDNENLPFYRFAQAMFLIERLSSGISGQEMEKILEVMEKAVADGLSKPKPASVVATCIHALRERQSNIIHKDLLLNIAAVWTVRDDETVTGALNPKIQAEKLELFERLAQKEGEHAFFISLAIERLKPLLSISPEQFNELWQSNQAQIASLNKQMELLTSALITGLKGSSTTSSSK